MNHCSQRLYPYLLRIFDFLQRPRTTPENVDRKRRIESRRLNRASRSQRDSAVRLSWSIVSSCFFSKLALLSSNHCGYVKVTLILRKTKILQHYPSIDGRRDFIAMKFLFRGEAASQLTSAAFSVLRQTHRMRAFVMKMKSRFSPSIRLPLFLPWRQEAILILFDALLFVFRIPFRWPCRRRPKPWSFSF